MFNKSLTNLKLSNRHLTFSGLVRMITCKKYNSNKNR